MPEKRAGASTGTVVRKSGSRKAASDPNKAVRVWGEAGITVAISENPPQYVKVMFGHERVAPDGTLETLKRVTALIDEYNEEVVMRQAKKYARLALAVATEEDEPPKRSLRRRS